MNTSCAVSAACTSDCDVLVIGGGPAGSTAAALLAERGYRVTLLEKAHHPRFHIGESLLPANLPLLEKLGVADAVKAIGMEKWAAEFVSPWHDHKQAFQFADAMDKSMPMAFIDPVFSSGVMLAVHSAFVEADTVDTCLRHPQQAAAALKKFDRTMRVGPKAFSWFIYRVTNPTLRDMFMGPRNIFRVNRGAAIGVGRRRVWQNADSAPLAAIQRAVLRGVLAQFQTHIAGMAQAQIQYPGGG